MSDPRFAVGPLAELAPIAQLVGSTRIDGIPTIYAPRDGYVAAGILFRVGMVDEPLARSGITHLVEHLALFDHSNGDVHHNGETSDAFTHFYVAGTEAEVVAYLNRVCHSLRNLPLDRIETEKQILRTESSQKAGNAARAQRVERFGATGFGTVGMVEPGLDAITADDVLEWSRTRFTRHNAIVWMTAPQPLAGLDLTLPDGSWIPLPPPREIIDIKPAFFGGPGGGVMLDAVVPRSTAGTVFSLVASKALYRSLRQQGGYSYTATCDYEPLDGQRARIALYADALPNQQAAVVGGMIDVLASLRAGAIDPADLTYAKGTFGHMSDVPFLGSTLLLSTAQRLLLGAPINHPASIVAEAEAVTAADIAGIADLVWRDAVAQIPEGNLTWAGFTLAPRSSANVVTGDRFPYIQYPDSAVVIGKDGVSFVGPDNSSTVYFADCAAVLAAPDGGRAYIGTDAFRVLIEPTLLDGITPDILRWLDSRVPPEVVVPQRARLAADIPQPGPPVIQPPQVRVKKGLGAWAWLALLPTMVASFLLLMLASGEMRSVGVADASGRVVGVPEMVITWVVTLAVTVFAFYLLVGLQRRRIWRRVHGSA